jgi:uncharacterized protein YneF (UPF0154 family)
MVFIISIALIIAFVMGYLIVTKTLRSAGKPVNPTHDLKPVRDENYRPKY